MPLMPNLLRLGSLKRGLVSNVNVKAKLSRLERINAVNEYNLNINLQDETWATFVRLNKNLLTVIIYVLAHFLTS